MAVKETKTKKPSATNKPRSSLSHPSFYQMITDAIVTLKERAGSSQYAITKFNEEKYKQLPPNFRKLLLYHLKKLVSSDKLVKVKNSYKLPSVRPAPAPAKKPSESKPKAAAVKPKAKTALKLKPKASVKPNASTGVKPKAAAKPKNKVKKSAPATKPVVKTKTVRKPISKKSPAKKTRK